MNIKQALKEKNKLIKEISENTKLMQEYNSIEDGNERPYNISELFLNIVDATRELSQLKAKIHRANGPVLEDIFLMAEMKSVKSVGVSSSPSRKYATCPSLYNLFKLSAITCANSSLSADGLDFFVFVSFAKVLACVSNFQFVLRCVCWLLVQHGYEILLAKCCLWSDG